MTRNEVFFALGDGDSEPELIDVPPAPSAPSHGMAEIVDTPVVIEEIGYVPDSEVVTPEVLEVFEERMTRKRARRFHADTPFVLGVLLFLIACLAGASFYVSFSGLFAAAEWAVGVNPPLQFAVPIMLDIAIIAFTLSLFVERERGDKVWGTWLAIAVFAAVSATSNILHTLVVSTATNLSQLVVGAVISGGAPILLAFATDKIAVKVFKTAHPVTK